MAERAVRFDRLFRNVMISARTLSVTHARNCCCLFSKFDADDRIVEAWSFLTAT
jgi:hypothetical protein